MADDILRQGVVGISEIIIKPGLVNVDFADVRCDVWRLFGTWERGRGFAVFGIYARFAEAPLSVVVFKAMGQRQRSARRML